MGAVFVLMLVELLLDLSLLWRLELLLNHWGFFYQKESLFKPCLLCAGLEASETIKQVT